MDLASCALAVPAAPTRTQPASEPSSRALGRDGRGHIGMQNMLGKIDIVMGSFSKTFASNGGFVACKTRAVKEYLRFYSAPATFSNALSPVQAATILKAFEIAESVEGRVLRLELMTNILSLREQLRAAGLDYYGDPSAIVCVKMGTEGVARLVSKRRRASSADRFCAFCVVA